MMLIIDILLIFGVLSICCVSNESHLIIRPKPLPSEEQREFVIAGVDNLLNQLLNQIKTYNDQEGESSKEVSPTPNFDVSYEKLDNENNAMKNETRVDQTIHIPHQSFVTPQIGDVFKQIERENNAFADALQNLQEENRRENEKIAKLLGSFSKNKRISIKDIFASICNKMKEPHTIDDNAKEIKFP